MFIHQQLSIWQVGIELRNVSLSIGNIRGAAEVVTMIEEGLFFRSVVGNVTVTSLRVIRVARIIPAYRWTRVGIRRSVRAWSLNPTLWHIMVAKFCEDGIISNTRVLWITYAPFSVGTPGAMPCCL